MTALRKFLALLVILFLPCLAHADWEPVQTIYTSPDPGFETPVSVGVDNEGNAVAVGVLQGTIVASTRPFQGSWTSPVTISLSSTSIGAQLAVDGAGNAIAVWSDAAGLQSSTYTFGVGWSAPVNVDTGGILPLKIQMTSDGKAILVWCKQVGPDVLVRYTTSTIFSPWLPGTTIASSTSQVGGDLGISENGDGIASLLSGGRLQAINLPFSGPLASPVDLVTLSMTAQGLSSVALDPAGNGVVVWNETSSTINSAIYYLGSWFNQGPIVGTVLAKNPNVAVDVDGNAVAVWTQSVSGVNEIHGAYLPFGTGIWQPTSVLHTGTRADFAKVGIDKVGNAISVWQTTAPPVIVQARTLPAGTLNWGPSVDLFLPVANSFVQERTPNIDLNASGNVIAFWNLDDSSTPLSSMQTAANNIPSTSTSTLVATPTVVLADGVNSSGITVTVLDGNGVPIQGNTIVLTQSGSAVISPSASGITNANGQVTFTVTDTTAQTVTFTATDQQTSIVIGTVDVTFVTPADSALSTIVANPTVVEANGVDFSTVTVTLKDSGGNLLSGHTVQLSQSPNISTITPATAVTVAGVAQFQVSSTNLGSVTYTATDITVPATPVVLDGTATVIFIEPKTSAAKSTVVAVPTSVEADGIATSTITVTLRNANNNPVPGHTVQLTQNVGGNSVMTTVNAVTNALGQAFFTVKDLVVESVTYTATDLTNGPVVVSQQAVVNFIPLIPDVIKSTITATPPAVPADGVAFSTVTVTLLNVNGVPISGHDVRLNQGAGSSSITPLIGTTNSNGQVFFTVRDLKSEVVTYTATDITAGIELTGTAQVEFLERVTDAFVSTVNANPTSVFADGVSKSIITVRLKNINGAPVVGHNVSLVANGGSSIISPPSGPSDASGIVTFTVTDTAVENVTYTATDLTDGVVINQRATVKFTPPPPLPPSDFVGIRVENKFATHRSFTDILTWTPSPDKNVVSYRIYVNGVLEKTIPALGPFRAEFKHRCDNLTYVYRLVAVSNAGVESSPLFVTLPH